MNTKKVNIFPRRAITTVNPPIRIAQYNITKSIKDIRMCIVAGAKVEEVFPDGRTVILNLNNYDLDNSKSILSNTESKPMPNINVSGAVKANAKKVAFSSPANVVIPNVPVQKQSSPSPETKSDTPIEKTSVEEPKEEIIEQLSTSEDITENDTTPETTVYPEEKAEDSHDDTAEKIEQHLTRRQRRALERAKAEEAANKANEDPSNNSESVEN